MHPPLCEFHHYNNNDDIADIGIFIILPIYRFNECRFEDIAYIKSNRLISLNLFYLNWYSLHQIKLGMSNKIYYQKIIKNLLF